jgi:hypothetical protein
LYAAYPPYASYLHDDVCVCVCCVDVDRQSNKNQCCQTLQMTLGERAAKLIQLAVKHRYVTLLTVKE